ncbi:restriction endonuclease subunit S [Staphylococcus cohnii]|uniref:restriction endonuclease subunit S n=1 Tax=Staphylococcus cohnii TaxID=29382 RepID=UPI0018668934|nr:restriction endonuclease subunit S [Staphylococcus cohnii]
MTNEVKNIPELRFPEFIEEWCNKDVGQVVNVYDGTHQTPKYTNKGIKFLSVENIKTLKSNKFISKEAFEKDFKVRPELGDILMTRIGDVGTPKVVNSNEDLAYYVSLALLKPKSIHSYFLEALIKSPTIQNEIWRKTLHIAFPKKINKNEIAKIMISYPKSEEQQKIGDFFSKLDRQIELEEQKLEKLEEQKKGYMQKIFSQELRFKDNNGEEYPKWESKKLEEVAIINTGKSKIVNEESAAYSNLGSTGVLGKSSHYEYDGNFILTARVGHYAGKLYNFSGKANISDNTIFLETDLNLNFTLNMLNNYNLKRIAFGSGQPLIKSSELKKLIFNIPCGEEEQKIGGFLSGFDSLIGKQSHKIELLRERKKGFLQKMFV